ncbi:DUF3037 domain-containing protein [Mucilaginibacter sp. Bleaf8]|uniref:DUF3037 domain-containing protein n=1 Tax=Mucilaginibacter sp. Bleaf8 TaxID=2834430 RepID=UPI001BCE3062|nr:DUF3037 domain-containing protein [Mucilaginibacter sp. Bleaf8]MBS7563596.1 DUF3037 domain-containing protein [Mucilaginibacter sp. Bleaf8]
MPEPHLFEYAVIRVVPRVEREEFLNIGVILYCPKQKFLQCQFTINEDRIRAFAPVLDIDELKGNIEAFEKICNGGKGGGPIGMLDIASRFRWLTATRSTVVQASKVHPGLCNCEAHQTLTKLHAQQVL